MKHQLLLALAFCAPLAFGATALAQGPGPSTSNCVAPAGVDLWSDSAFWGGTLPDQWTDVVIPAGKVVWFDQGDFTNPVQVKSLTIHGELHIKCGPRHLISNFIHVSGGLLQAGTRSDPYPYNVTFTLAHDATVTNLGDASTPGELLDQALVVEDGGRLILSGRNKGKSWVRLNQTANSGATQIVVDSAVNWRAGDSIVLASSDYDYSQAETVLVTGMQGTTVQLASPLVHTHWGQIEGPFANGMSVDERAEVGLLSRSIVIEGTPFTHSDGRTMGGHTMLHLGQSGAGAVPSADVQWVEFRDLGREGSLARYPIHMHETGSAAGTRYSNCSIHRSLNRVLSLHDCNDAEFSDNVGYDHIGHGFYFETKDSQNDTMVRNLGLGTHAAQAGWEIHGTDLEPATFWMVSPNNTVTDNAAAGSESYGFWLEPVNDDPTNPVFDRNVAHSNGTTGVHQDTRPDPVSGLIKDLTIYKNRQHGLWWRTYEKMTFEGLMMADNRGGCYLASEGTQHADLFSEVVVKDSLFVGESSNLGELTSDIEIAHGRSLPQKSTDPFLHGTDGPMWDALVGVEFYDGFVTIENTHFANYQSAASSCAPPQCSVATTFNREAGALGNVYYHNPWAVLPTNVVRGLSFQNADEVWLRNPVGYPNKSDNGIANTVFIDEDGSVTGTQMTYVRPVNPFLDHVAAAGTVFHSTWNAHTVEMYQSGTKYLYGLFQFEHDVPQAPALTDFLLQSYTRGSSFIAQDARSNGAKTLFPSAMVADDLYLFSNPLLTTSQWPSTFSFRWMGTEPGKFLALGIPNPSPNATVKYNGQLGDIATNLTSLLSATVNTSLHDPATGFLYIKVFTGGPNGGSVWDGTVVRVTVTP